MNHIFGIGISDYQNCNNLDNPVRDIENTIDVLVEKYGFTNDNVSTLFNSAATRENLINQLESYTNLTPNDNLIIVFAGHGEFDEKIDLGYLLTHETVPLNKSTYLEYSSIYNYLKAIDTHHTLIISDSCFSGSFFKHRKLDKLELAKDRLGEIPSRWALTSGRIEPVVDGKPGENSPFADSLIRNLKTNKESLFSITELSNLIKVDVASTMEQIPRGEALQIKGHKGGEFIFRKNEHGFKVTTESSGNSNNDQLDSIINDYRVSQTLIEEAQNNHQAGTVKKLQDEHEYISKSLNQQVKNEFEILISNSVRDEITNPSTITKEISEQIIILEKVKKKKNEAVKNQQYEEAAELRGQESIEFKKVSAFFDETIDIKNIDFDNDKLSSILTRSHFWSKYSSSKISDEKSSELKVLFMEIYKLKLLYKNELIGKYKFEHDKLKLYKNIQKFILKLEELELDKAKKKLPTSHGRPMVLRPRKRRTKEKE